MKVTNIILIQISWNKQNNGNGFCFDIMGHIQREWTAASMKRSRHIWWVLLTLPLGWVKTLLESADRWYSAHEYKAVSYGPYHLVSFGGTQCEMQKTGQTGHYKTRTKKKGCSLCGQTHIPPAVIWFFLSSLQMWSPTVPFCRQGNEVTKVKSVTDGSSVLPSTAGVKPGIKN